MVVAIERVSTMQLLCPEGDKSGLNSHRFSQTAPTDDAVNLTNEKHDPNAQMNHLQKEENKKTLQKAPVWCRPITLRRLSYKYSHNSRVLEMGQLYVP